MKYADAVTSVAPAAVASTPARRVPESAASSPRAAGAAAAAGASADVAGEMARAAERAPGLLDPPEGALAGPVRLGSLASAVRDFLPDALERLADEHPDALPELVDGETDELLERVRRAELDLAIVESWSAAPVVLPAGVVAATLLEEELLLAIAPGLEPSVLPSGGSEPAPAEGFRIVELGEAPWTACPAASDAGEGLVAFGRDHGRELPIRFRLADYTAQLALVARGLAITLVPEMAAVAHPAIRYHRVEERPTRRILALTRPSDGRGAALGQLLAAVLAERAPGTPKAPRRTSGPSMG